MPTVQEVTLAVFTIARVLAALPDGGASPRVVVKVTGLPWDVFLLATRAAVKLDYIEPTDGVLDAIVPKPRGIDLSLSLRQRETWAGN